MAEPFAPYAGIEGAALTGGEGGDALHNLLVGILHGTVTLPKRVIDAAKATAPGLRREDFTDIPADAGGVFGLTGPKPWQPGTDLYKGAGETALMMMGGAPAVSGVSKAGEVALGIVPVDAGRAFGIPSRLPESDIFRQAVKNTPGAAVDAEALTMPLKRRQHPDQELSESVRGGVFYQPGGPGGYSYTGKNGYGGSQMIEGETAVKAPLFVKGATGGKAPEAAFDTLLGKGAYQNMRTDALNSYSRSFGNYEKEIAGATSFLEKYAPELAGNARHIVMNSREGNQLAYALQEAAVASAARKHGHDAVIGYSVGRDKAPRISEVFDVREPHYPGTAGEFETWPASMFGSGKVGALDAPRPPAVDLTPAPTGGMKSVKIGETTIDYGVARDGKSAEVILVKTPEAKRGEGNARRAMQEMIDAADKNSTTLFLNAEPMGKGVSQSKLVDFYESLGFVRNAGRNKDFTSRAAFVRPPKEK